MAEFFNITAETPGSSPYEFTALNDTGDNTITPTSDQAMSGSQSYAFEYDGVDYRGSAQKAMTQGAATDLYFVTNMRIKAGSTAGANALCIVLRLDDGYSLFAAGRLVHDASGVPIGWASYSASLGSSDVYYTGFATDTWHRLELHAVISATVGGYEFRVNGETVYTSAMDADTSAWDLDKIIIGNHDSGKLPANGSIYYFDNFAGRDTDWYGASLEPAVDVTGVTLTGDATLIAGNTLQLTPTVAPTNATDTGVTYESNDTDVATVDAAGEVTGVSAGDVTITVTTDDGDFTDTHDIEVGVAVTGVTLTGLETVAAGSIIALTATVAPINAAIKTVTYASDDENVAGVNSSGNVTGLAAGTATITVTTDDGDFTDTLDVVVTVVGEVVAASASSAHVTAAIAAASAGDVIRIPTGTATWAASVSIDKDVHILGNGKANTVITISGMIDGLSSDSPGVSIGNIGFTCVADIDSMVITHGTFKRIHHCHFNNAWTATVVGVQSSGYGTGIWEQVKGLVDHNTFTDCRGVVFGGQFMLPDVWYASSPIGTDRAVYYEDNIYLHDIFGNIMDANYSGAYCFRYNVATGDGISMEAHSVQGEHRSTRSWEVYRNIYTISTSMYRTFFFRGGEGVVHHNTLIGSEVLGYMDLNNVRSAWRTSDPGGANNADGDHPWDGNVGPTSDAYPCRDQIGRGRDITLGAVTDTWATTLPTQESVPVYGWDNTINGEPMLMGSADSDAAEDIQEDRDYFNETERPGYTEYTYPHPLQNASVRPVSSGDGSFMMKFFNLFGRMYV